MSHSKLETQRQKYFLQNTELCSFKRATKSSVSIDEFNLILGRKITMACMDKLTHCSAELLWNN